MAKHRINTRGRGPTFVPLAHHRVPLGGEALDVVQFPYMASKSKPLTQEQINAALAAIEHGRKVRKLHAKRTERGNRARQNDIKLALEQIKGAMKPIRSYLSSWHYGTQSAALEAKRDQMLSQYCQVYRIRKDGKPGHMLTTIPLIFSLLQLVRTS